MDNFTQVEISKEVMQVIEQHVGERGEELLEVEKCYKAYKEVIIRYKKQKEYRLSIVKQLILDIVKEASIGMDALEKLICINRLYLERLINELKIMKLIELKDNEVIYMNSCERQLYTKMYEKTVLIDPATLQIVLFNPDYSIKEEVILKTEFKLTINELLLLFPDVEVNEVENWYITSVAGMPMWKITTYNSKQRMKKDILYNANGQFEQELLCTIVKEEELKWILQKPSKMITHAAALNIINGYRKWNYIQMHKFDQSFITAISNITEPLLLVMHAKFHKEEKERIYNIEKRSKGLITVIEDEVESTIWIGSNFLIEYSSQQAAYYENQSFLAMKDNQLQNWIIQIAKETQHKHTLKAFLHLVERQISSDIMLDICTMFTQSEDLIQRGKILENNGYKEISKKVYNLGIDAHAQEVNS